LRKKRKNRAVPIEAKGGFTGPKGEKKPTEQLITKTHRKVQTEVWGGYGGGIGETTPKHQKKICTAQRGGLRSTRNQ